jgi:hypothetical protein
MKILIKNCRLAFPNLFQPRLNDDGSKKYGASLIIPRDHPAVKELEAAFPKIASEKWGDKGPAILKGLKQQDRLCLHDGDLKAQYTGFEGNLFVSASSQSRPSVFDRDRTPLTEDDGKPYSGCYVNASIELWPQDHKKHGKRINAQLRGVQFAKDGDAFAGGSPAGEDEFEDLGDQGDDTDPLA